MSMEIKHLKGKEARHIVRRFNELYPPSHESLRDSKDMKEVDLGGDSILLVDGEPLILRISGTFFPSLKFTALVDTLPKVVVDMGAVRHLVNGADLMRPGITEVKGEFGKGGLVAVLDEKFGKTIALGVAEEDSISLKASSRGRVIKIVHYVGDVFWQYITAHKEDRV